MNGILVRREDCRRAFFKGRGPGGQHRNKTETCVRYIHLPTGIQAEGKSERSRDANDKAAWKLLLAKVAHLVEERRTKDALARWNAKPDAAYGSQVRSYILDQDRRVVDHRSGWRGDPSQVVGRGRLDQAIRSFLLMSCGRSR